MQRKVKTKVKGFHTIDGAGVNLVRVLGKDTMKEFDPILMLDSFDTADYELYKAGFPMHPHRGIETISYVAQGAMKHRDSLGYEDTITSGEVQWMTAGSGIMHEELIPKSERLLGVQLWLNLPQKDKMTPPKYRAIKNSDIKEIQIEGGKIRVLAGKFEQIEGAKGEHLPIDYYDIHLKNGKDITIKTEESSSVMIFTLLGEIEVAGEKISEKTAVNLTQGDSVSIKALSDAQVLFISSVALNEPIAWGGPIVMNDKAELAKAFSDLERGEFIKS